MAGSRRVQTKTLNLPFALYHDGTRGWSVYGNPYGSGPQYGSGSATITGIAKGTTCGATRHGGVIPATGGTWNTHRSPLHDYLDREWCDDPCEHEQNDSVIDSLCVRNLGTHGGSG